MKLDKEDKGEFLKRFDEKVYGARLRYEKFLDGTVRVGDSFNLSFTLSLKLEPTEIKETRT